MMVDRSRQAPPRTPPDALHIFPKRDVLGFFPKAHIAAPFMFFPAGRADPQLESLQIGDIYPRIGPEAGFNGLCGQRAVDENIRGHFKVSNIIETSLVERSQAPGQQCTERPGACGEGNILNVDLTPRQAANQYRLHFGILRQAAASAKHDGNSFSISKSKRGLMGCRDVEHASCIAAMRDIATAAQQP